MRATRIMQVGLGPLGIRVCQMAENRSAEEIVSAADIDPDLSGKFLARHCGIDDTGVRITANLGEAVEHGQPDVAILTTVSDMTRIAPQILEILEFGIPVVTTCEELCYPWETNPELAKTIDRAAQEAGVAVLGTGINPGFLMDTLPAQLSALCSQVDYVEVRRFQDAQYRRLPFQVKIGAGLDTDAFNKKVDDGTLRHVGLTESMHFIAHQLGWKLTRTEDLITPVIAHHTIETEDMTIDPGFAAGVRQEGNGYVDDQLRIKLVFQAAVGEPESYDEIVLKGEPDITSRIEGGINGDIGTCAITLNAARAILHAKPGLRTMADMPMVSGLGV